MTMYGYVRVSSKDQNSIRQVEALRNVGVAEDNIFTDYASGKNFERDEYRRLLKLLRVGDTLIIKSIDRLGRNYKEIIEEWTSITKKIQANIKVIDLPLLDTSVSGKDLTGTFISDIVLQILSYVAEQERVNIRQRQAEGIALAKARGVIFGRPCIARPVNYETIYRKWRSNEIALEEALTLTNLKKSTFMKFSSEIAKGK